MRDWSVVIQGMPTIVSSRFRGSAVRKAFRLLNNQVVSAGGNQLRPLMTLEGWFGEWTAKGLQPVMCELLTEE